MVSYIHIHLFIFHGYIANSQYDQLPVGFIAQLVEHCTAIAAVMGSKMFQFNLSPTVQMYVCFLNIIFI